MSAIPLAMTSTACFNDLPPELVASIARNTDDATLLALASVSRGLRAKSFHVYGYRFFRTMKFCLYPHSLQALVDISYTPHLAKYVQYVAFGTEDVGLLDPVHDGEFRQGKAQHSLTLLSSLDDDSLLETRMRADSAVISQALIKLPKLQQVLVGTSFHLEGVEVRKSWGASRLKEFECPSDHCSETLGSRSVFMAYRTVVLALHQMGELFEHIKIGIYLDRADDKQLQSGSSPVVWEDAQNLAQRITTLQLQIYVEDGISSATRILHLVDAATIKSLESHYVGPQKRVESQIHTVYLPFRHLQRVVVKGLWATVEVFSGILYSHRYRLKQVSMIECSIKPVSEHPPPQILEHSEAMEHIHNGWLSVVRELLQLPELGFVHLSHLEQSPYLIIDSSMPYDRLNSEMSVSATWQNKDEVQKGLGHIVNQGKNLVYRVLKPLPLFGPVSSIYYFNLRLANKEVSASFSWTRKELAVLKEHENFFPYLPGIRQLSPPSDRCVPLPTNTQNLPDGHELLLGLLWGQWQTVWVKNARLSPGNW